MENNTLAPQGTATRAQVAQILMNFHQKLDKVKSNARLALTGDGSKAKSAAPPVHSDRRALKLVKEPRRWKVFLL